MAIQTTGSWDDSIDVSGGGKIVFTLTWEVVGNNVVWSAAPFNGRVSTYSRYGNTLWNGNPETYCSVEIDGTRVVVGKLMNYHADSSLASGYRIGEFTEISVSKELITVPLKSGNYNITITANRSGSSGTQIGSASKQIQIQDGPSVWIQVGGSIKNVDAIYLKNAGNWLKDNFLFAKANSVWSKSD